MGPYDMLHLLNLVTLDDLWRNAADTPPVQTDIGLRYYLGNEAAEAVYLASPDFGFARTVSLSYTTDQDECGRYIEFKVPRLAYWDMVYLKRAPDSASRRIQSVRSEPSPSRSSP
jgi:hypothetical protein